MVVDIIHGIKEKAENIPVSVKISAGDMSPRDMLETCKLLVDAGVSIIE